MHSPVELEPNAEIVREPSLLSLTLTNTINGG